MSDDQIKIGYAMKTKLLKMFLIQKCVACNNKQDHVVWVKTNLFSMN